MAYRDLLVHLDDSQGCMARTAAAVQLAAQHGAHLTGLYPIVEIPLLSYIRARIPPDLRARMAAEAEAAATLALARFRAAAAAAGIGHGTRTAQALDTTVARVLARHARHADLVVLGQVDPQALPRVGPDLAEEVVLSCGRPVLVVPRDWRPHTLGQRVLVAWDASREAARAVSDALPVLEQAASVLVVRIEPRSTRAGHGAVPGADIGLHLARHGIEVAVESIAVDRIGVGEALLSVATERARDLLVMGAFGHARMRELILGGATRTVLGGTTLPALMAH